MLLGPEEMPVILSLFEKLEILKEVDLPVLLLGKVVVNSPPCDSGGRFRIIFNTDLEERIRLRV